VTALLLGLAIRRLGLLDRGPLFFSDSYGILLLGLMGLFVNILANNPLGNLIRLLPAVLITLALSSLILVLGGFLCARAGRFSPWRGIALTMNTMMGFPVNKALIEEASQAGTTPAERGFIASQLEPVLGMGTMLVSNALSILVVSILVNMI
jgi:hypothetical protein